MKSPDDIWMKPDGPASKVGWYEINNDGRQERDNEWMFDIWFFVYTDDRDLGIDGDLGYPDAKFQVYRIPDDDCFAIFNVEFENVARYYMFDELVSVAKQADDKDYLQISDLLAYCQQHFDEGRGVLAERQKLVAPA